MDETVQGLEPQGGETTPGIFDSYLQAVPEDAREAVTGYLRDAEKNVNGRLAEAAELKKTWEPYQDVQASLAAYDPEQLNQLLAWHQQVSASPDAFKDWLTREAQEAGLTLAEAEAQIDEQVESGELTPERIQQLAQQAAEDRFAPIEERVAAFEREKETDTEWRAIEDAWGDIQKEHKLDLTKDQKAVILDLGMPLAVDDKGNDLPAGDASWVKAGFDRWKEITTAGQRAFVEQKAQQPGAALTSGGTPALKPTTDWGEAASQLRERLRQQS